MPKPSSLAIALGAAVLLLSLASFACSDRPKSNGFEPHERDRTTEPDRVRFRLSGEMRGMLEPCGCASGQLGGLARRIFKLHEDKDYDLLIEGGNLAAGGSELDLQKTFTALTALDFDSTRYHAIGIGPLDLEQEPEEYGSILQVPRAPLVASDLVPKEGFSWPVKAFIAVEAGQGKIPVRIASLAMQIPKSATGTKVTLLSPADAWKRALEGATASTLRVLLAHGDAEQIASLTKLDPKPDLVVGFSNSHHEPPELPDNSKEAPVVWPAVNGRFLLDVWLTREAGKGKITRYRRIPLEGSPSSPGAMEDEGMKSLLLAHRMEVAKNDVLTRMADQKPTKDGATYVGSKVCGSCHPAALLIWEKSKHAQAWKTLEDAEAGKLVHKSTGKPRYGWPTTKYPDCVGCHVVGYGFKSGFVDKAKTEHLTDVGCESCHGAGSQHSDAQLGKIPKDKGVLGRCDPVLCTACHNFEQSPTFDYSERWKKIEHGR